MTSGSAEFAGVVIGGKSYLPISRRAAKKRLFWKSESPTIITVACTMRSS